MKVAYLINQYPKVSHSFIRREIIALENQGLEIIRYSIRPTNPHTLVDQEDKSELEKTQPILAQGIFRLIFNLILLFLLKPISFLKSFFLALKMGRKSHRGILRHIAYLAEACTLWRSLRDQNISHIHAHFGTNSATVALLCHNLGRVTYSFTVHGPEEFDQPEVLSLRTKIEQASFVVAISSYGKSQLYRWCDFKHWEKITIIRCGLDPSYLEKPFQPIPNVCQLVCVGRLCEQKGQLLLLQAAKILQEQGVKFNLVLVGDGEMRSPIENLIQQYNLGAEIKITGWADNADVQRYILNSRGLVLPSFAEGLPVVIMESFALARPVISTYIAAIPELVEPQKSGWLVSAGCIESLADAMKEMLATPVDKLTEMGKIGQIKVQQNHDVMLETRKLAQLIRIC
jgi:glycosyltransferase involved in cell wall biosynthesis